MSRTAPEFWSPKLDVERRVDGSIVIEQAEPLGDWGRALPDRLVHWAAKDPDRIFLARRDHGGDWRHLSYGQVLAAVRRIGSGLLAHGLTRERPLLILSENSLEHACFGLAAQYIGVPYAPVSPAYSVMSKDHNKLKGIVETLKPGMIFAQDGTRFATAIAAIRRPGMDVVLVENTKAVGGAIPVEGFGNGVDTSAAEAAFALLGRDTVAKFLFTSGSTGSPKAVINTQKMLMSNMAMVADCFRFLADHPPVIVDWAPWNHTASGNKVFNLTLYHGGTFYVDDGKPAAALIGETIRNLKEISPTWYFNVPTGWDMLVRAFEADEDLCRSFFARLDMMMYAGAGMAQHTWDALLGLSRRYAGREVLLTSGLGSTETTPFALQCTKQFAASGNIGVPARGISLKLVPSGGKLEARLKGPSVTPGYFGDPVKTAEAFDDEGYYLLGDALRPADPDDFSQGFFFDGRVAENFKLRTGTWVAVGALRAAVLNHFGVVLRDAVITGEDQDSLGALLFLNEAPLRDRFGGDETFAALLLRDDVRAWFGAKLTDFSAAATGSATRITRLILLADPPDLDKGEVTDKGSINQRAVLNARAGLVAALYADAPEVILCKAIGAN